MQSISRSVEEIHSIFRPPRLAVGATNLSTSTRDPSRSASDRRCGAATTDALAELPLRPRRQLPKGPLLELAHPLGAEPERLGDLTVGALGLAVKSEPRP